MTKSLMIENDDLHRIYSTVDAEFEEVNRCIKEQLGSEVPLVETIGHYIIEAGGKRLRPLLVLLAAKTCGYQQGDQHTALAVIIEFLHTATLLHDDIVDQSHLRRGRSTANATWGNAPSVLVGDFLYSRAFEMMVKLGDLEVMAVLARATRIIAEGEVMQLSNIGNSELSEELYQKVIRNKTAMLFEASAQTGAMLGDADSAASDMLRRYGSHLGLAFQLVDDLLDYTGNSATMGKNVGDDLAEGKVTLPLIYTMQHGQKSDAALVRRAISDSQHSAFDEVIAAVRRSGALKHTAQAARSQAQLAIEALHELPCTPYKENLTQLAHYAVSRTG